MDHATRPPTPIEQYHPGINIRLARAIMTCIEQEVSNRCPSMEQFLKSIKGIDHEDQR
jgi:hypothetical protein